MRQSNASCCLEIRWTCLPKYEFGPMQSRQGSVSFKLTHLLEINFGTVSFKMGLRIPKSTGHILVVPFVVNSSKKQKINLKLKVTFEPNFGEMAKKRPFNSSPFKYLRYSPHLACYNETVVQINFKQRSCNHFRGL